MSLRRSARVKTEPHAVAGAPNGPVEPVAAPSRKRGRKTSTTKAIATDKIAQDGVSSEADETSSVLMPPPPTTPNKRRKVATSPIKAPPLTPTPSAIGLMTSNSVLRPSYSSGDIDDPTPPPEDRPAQPHHTNATLVTPGGTQVLPTYSNLEDSPSKRGAAPEFTTTTTCLLDEAVAHLLSVDPTLKPVIDAHPCRVFSPAGLAETIDPFRSLASGIMAQQVSGAAAKSIKNKFVALFPPQDCPTGFPPATLVAQRTVPDLRQAGLSQRKAEYIQGLAAKFVAGDLTIPMLMDGSDEEVMASLVAVRGLGVWSVEMFMCFGLKRMDVFSTGDLGVQRGLGGKAKDAKWKYMKEAEMLEMAEKYRPWRSVFMWYMWRVEDVDVTAIEGDAG
ncbi:3-methyladenine DNA glycosylase [Teratosphaeriaceae sp. CCFEE 6253]|nr:3-methyladenine DNA glycosylase [Teratosphaeriaceae sp. CCFEE 6253]